MTSRPRTSKRTVSRKASPRSELAKSYHCNGYVRRQNSSRRRKEGHAVYKKGDEIRLVAASFRELQRIKSLAKRAGFLPGKPFRKGRQYRLPFYGRAVVAEFLKYIGHDDA